MSGQLAPYPGQPIPDQDLAQGGGAYVPGLLVAHPTTDLPKPIQAWLGHAQRRQFGHRLLSALPVIQVDHASAQRDRPA